MSELLKVALVTGVLAVSGTLLASWIASRFKPTSLSETVAAQGNELSRLRKVVASLELDKQAAEKRAEDCHRAAQAAAEHFEMELVKVKSSMFDILVKLNPKAAEVISEQGK